MTLFRKYMDDAFQFLEPMAEHDLPCALGVGAGAGVSAGAPIRKLFKCKVGDNFVSLNMSDRNGLAEARRQCTARSDLDVEPVGGAGHMVLDPTPDTRLATDLFVRSRDRQQKRGMFTVDLWIVFALFLSQVLLLVFNHVI